MQGHRRVLLVDGDEQRSAMTVTELRAQNGVTDYTAVSLLGASLRSQVKQLASNYDDVIIDVGGRDTGSFRAALTVTDRVLVPTQPRTLDVWAMEQVVELVQEAQQINPKLRAFSVLNVADAQGKDNDQAAQALREYEPTITYLNAPLIRRKAWADAIAQGKGVNEYTPQNNKAVGELTTLIAFVYQSTI
jgi:chromosome partitioning protein